MGRTSFSGPAYGAKSLITTVTRASIAPSSSNLELLEITLPLTEDWMITEVRAYCSNQGNGGTVDVTDDAVTILPTPLALVTAAGATAVLAADGGEDEGKRVAAGSVLRVLANDGITTAAADVVVNVYGFIRNARG